VPEDTEKLLANFVRPEERFARSTNIEQDNKNPEGVPDYKFTPKSLRLLDDILDSSKGVRRDRAWSIIGPYGSGKSTFLLFLLQLFGGSSSSWLQRCLVHLCLASPDIEQKLKREQNNIGARYIPITIQGTRTPLDLALCKALLKTATDINQDTSWVSEGFLSSLNITIQTIESNINDYHSTIELYEQAAELVRIAGYRGLLVTIDEFGKFLERARWQGDLPDLASAQYLAELASSLDEPKILFIVSLHQGFQHYASSLSRQQWLEWVKIQGRFSQIDFSEEPENLYGLVAASIKLRDKSQDIQIALRNWVSRVWNQVKSIPSFKTDVQTSYWPDLLKRIYPLHPITLYALPRLSASLGQNERTLFTFLASDDPLGLKSFLKRTKRNGNELPSLTLDYLYDYFVTGSRVTWLPVEAQRKVAEVESALERLGDRPPEESRLIKIIGVLGLLKTGSLLPASEQVLNAALDVNANGNGSSIQNTLNNLVVRKIIVYRQFAEEYRIWEGSDFDFDGALAKAREEIQSDFDLTTALGDVIVSTPLFARRHSFETGTNRLFRAKLIAASDLLEMGNDNLSEMLHCYKSDGIVLYSIPSTLQELNKLRQWASNLSEPRVLVVIPTEPLGLSYLVLDLAALRKIQRDWPELEDDNIAMKELASRIESTEDFLNDSLSSVLEPNTKDAIWYWCGRLKIIPNRRILNETLSEICDEIFTATPKIRNELINRENISSQVVVAVKKIIQGLLFSSNEIKVGLHGNGPEISIFTAVLEEHGLFKEQRSGQWRLVAPKKEVSNDINAGWFEIEQFLRSTGDSAKTFEELYYKLSAPPYGLRKGVISFLIWTVLIYFHGTVSLYENNTYIRDWTVELFDKFVRAPSLFSVRRLLLPNIKGKLLQKLNKKIPNANNLRVIDSGVPLNGFLSNLYGWYSTLSDYTKQTHKLSQEAEQFFNILLTVTDPIDFIFDKIPSLFGLDNLRSVIENDTADNQRKYLKRYVRKFGAIIDEIDKAYPELINEIIIFLASRFGSLATVTDLQQLFQAIDSEIIEHIVDKQAKAFVLRARQTHANDLLWIESTTSALCDQAPKFWSDHHLEEFKNKLSVVILQLNEARRSHYARNIVDGKQPRRMKRVIIEEQGELVLENYFLEEETAGDIDEASRNLIQIIDTKFPTLSQRSKQILLAKTLESLNSNTNG